ncbi:MAG: PAS domain S-box protein [Planctomycetaceae bacterium]|nr:PAS domain S-box protein [Planctomycetaceae bacterium]
MATAPERTPPASPRWMRLAAVFLALASGLTAAQAIVCWLLDRWDLASWGRGLVPIAPSTAVLILLLSACAVLRPRYPSRAVAGGLVLLGVLAAIAMGLLVLAQGAFDFELPLERWLSPTTAKVDEIPIGRMSPLTAAVFLPIATALLFQLRQCGRRWLCQASSILLLMASLCLFVVLLSYAAGAPVLYGSRTIPMALPTAVAMGLLGLSVLAGSGPQVWPLSLLVTGPLESASPNPVAKGPILVSLALVAAVAFSSVFYARHEISQVRQAAYTQLSAIAKLKVDQIVAWQNERLADAQLAAMHILQSDVARWSGGADEASKAAIVEHLRMLQRIKGYENAILADANGRRLLSLDAHLESLDDSAALLVARIVASRAAMAGDLLHCPSCRRIHHDVGAPVLGGDGQPIAVILLRSDPEHSLYPLLQMWPTPSRTSETLLIRKEADDVLFLNKLRHRGDAALTVRIPMSKADVPAVRAAMGQSGRFSGRDYRGVEVLADVRPVPLTPWFIIAKVDAREILSEAAYRGWVALLLAALLTLMTGGATALVYHRRQRNLYQSLFLAERQRRQVQEEIRATFYGIGDGVISTDATGCVSRMNGVAEQLTGWTEAQALGKPLDQVFRIINEDTRLEVESPVGRVLREGVIVGLANHTLLIARDGSECPIADSGAPVRDEHGRTAGVVLVFRDVADQRQSQQEMLRLNRSLRAISDCNQAIIRATEESLMHGEICRIIHGVGGYPFVCISMREDDEGKSVRGVAQAGADQVYLDDARVTWADTPRGRGPTGTAIRTGRPSIVQRTADDSRYAPWREMATAHGFLSSAAFPLMLDGKAFGALTVCAGVADAFTPQEAALLEELAGDVAYGVAALRTASTLGAQQEELRAVHDNISIMTFLTDRDRNIVFANRAGARFVGLPQDQLVGQRVCGVLGCIHANDDPRGCGFGPHCPQCSLLQTIQDTLATGQAHQDVEQRMVRVKDAQRQEAVLIASTAMIQPAGQARLLLCLEDATQRKEAQEALSESEARFRSFIEAAPEGFFVQSEGRFAFVNQALLKIMGASTPEELLGKDFFPRIAPEYHQKVRDRIRFQRETGQAVSAMDQEFLRLDGSRVPVETAAAPIRYKGGEANLVFVRDITDRRRLQEQLRQSQKMEAIGQLAGGVAHDFRNQLTVIKGFAEMLLRRSLVLDSGVDQVQEILKAAQRSTLLTGQLLAFSRTQMLTPQRVDLVEIVVDIIKAVPHMVGEHVRLSVSASCDRCLVEVDPTQLQQALINLVANARDAMPDGGELTIEVSRRRLDDPILQKYPDAVAGVYAAVAVADTGCGMDDATLSRLFEPFFTTKEVGRGTGLGLAMVYGFVKQSGGIIDVESRLGQGSTFTLYFPQCDDAQATGS